MAQDKHQVCHVSVDRTIRGQQTRGRHKTCVRQMGKDDSLGVSQIRSFLEIARRSLSRDSITVISRGMPQLLNCNSVSLSTRPENTCPGRVVEGGSEQARRGVGEGASIMQPLADGVLKRLA